MWFVLTCVRQLIYEWLSPSLFAWAVGRRFWLNLTVSTIWVIESRRWITVRLELILSLPGHIVLKIFTEGNQVAIILSRRWIILDALKWVTLLLLLHAMRWCS